MKGPYKNSPITEAVCEFIFDINNPIDSVFVDKFYNEIKSIFPIRRNGVNNQIDFILDPEGKETVKKTTEEFNQFFSSDEKTFLQLKNDGKVSIHKIKPYDTWTNFSHQISEVLDNYLKYSEIKLIKRIGLRYINNFQILEDSFKLEEYFNFRPATFGSVPPNLSSFLVSSIFAFEDNRDSTKVQLVNIPNNTNKANFILDIDYYLNIPDTIKLDNIHTWVEQAHTHTENMFESILTSKIKETFN